MKRGAHANSNGKLLEGDSVRMRPNVSCGRVMLMTAWIEDGRVANETARRVNAVGRESGTRPFRK